MTIEELKLASGGFGVPGAIIGGVAGAVGYYGNAAVTGGASAGGLASAVVAGAAAGAVLGPGGGTAIQNGAALIAASQVTFYAGQLAGHVSNVFNSIFDQSGTDYNNAAGTNYN
ncbi:hypothetical protein IN820_04895 [Pseudomonas sp. AL-54]|nr:hypothetical protein [Pseudomonas lopnurensis]